MKIKNHKENSLPKCPFCDDARNSIVLTIEPKLFYCYDCSIRWDDDFVELMEPGLNDFIKDSER